MDGRRGAFGGPLPPRSPLLLFKDLPNHADDHVSPVEPVGWEQRSELGYLRMPHQGG